MNGTPARGGEPPLVVSIIIPVHNQSAFTKNCLESLFTFPPEEPYEIIVVDDGSTDDTALVLARLAARNPCLRWVANPPPHSFARACNRGAAAAAGDFLLFLNNDTEALPGWLPPLLTLLRRQPAVGVAAPVLLFPDGKVQHCGKIWRRGAGGELAPEHLHYGVAVEEAGTFGGLFQSVTGACMLLRRDEFLRFGPFDEQYENGWEDDDLCLAFRSHGLGAFVCADSVLVHHQGGTLKAEAERIERYLSILRSKGTVVAPSDPLLTGLAAVAAERAETFGRRYRHNRALFFRKWGQLIMADEEPAQPLGASSRIPRISIIIPVYNQLHLTVACLDAVYSVTGGALEQCEVIVVDNGSSDGTAEHLAGRGGIVTVSLARNMGFAAGCNAGAAHAKGELLLFLNNDTEVCQGWLEPLVTALGEPQVGAAGGKLVFPDGTIQHAGVIFMADPAAGVALSPCHVGYRCSDGPEFAVSRTFSAVTAACLAIPRGLFLLAGGFCERYWNGFEDADLCCRLQSLGFRIRYCPDSVVVHYESQSGEERSRRQEANLALLQERWGTAVRTDFVRVAPDRVVPDTRTTIVIVTYNSAGTIEACLSSVMATIRPGDEVIVVDNASQDGTLALVEAAGAGMSVQLVRNRANAGFSAATNQGVRAAHSPFVVLLNPDTVVTRGWLDGLTAYFSDERVAAVGPVSNYAAGRQSVACHWQGNLPEGVAPDEAAALLAAWNKGRSESTRLLVGFCLVVRRDLLARLGGLDERLFLGNDDLELSWRLRAHGFDLRIANDVFVYHEGQHSFRTEPASVTGLLVQESSDVLYRILACQYGPGRVPTPRELWGMDWFTPAAAEFNPHVRFHQLLNSPFAFMPCEPAAAPLASIVILTFNRQECTAECLASISRFTPERHEIIVVDNGSTDGTVPWLQELAAGDARYRLILNDGNRGYAAGCNQGIRAAEGAYVVLLNNDVVVTPEWLTGMIDCHRGVSNAGVVGPLTNNASGIQVVASPGYETIDGLEPFAARFRARHRHRRVFTRRLVGFCLLFPRKLSEEIGLLDERFGIGNYEDDDFCLRATIAGYRNVVAGDVYIHHHGSMSFRGNGIDYNALLAENRGLFREKWSRPVPDRALAERIRWCRAREDAELLLGEERYAEAVGLLSSVRAELPENRAIVWLLCRVLLTAGRPDEAFAVLDMGEESPDPLQESLLAAECLLAMRQPDEAERCIARQVNKITESSVALTILAQIYSLRGWEQLAGLALRMAIDADPASGSAYIQLGTLVQASGQEEYAAALIAKGFLLEPTLPAHIHAVTAIPGGIARETAEEAVRLHPHSKTLARLRCELLAGNDEQQPALGAIEEFCCRFGVDEQLLAIGLDIRRSLGIVGPVGRAGKRVSLCMIVRDEEGNLPRALASLKPLVHEVIVVDTGSVDRSVDIAALFGARVLRQQWTDDFAAARNASLEAATGDWILVMDADETISVRDHALFQQLLEGVEQSFALAMETRNYTTLTSLENFRMHDGRYPEDEAGHGWTPSTKIRLFPNRRGIRFRGFVHEMVESSVAEAGLAVREFPVPVHHYGGLEEGRQARKRAVYYEMGKRKLRTAPDDCKALYELAVQAGELERFAEAEGLWLELLRHDPAFAPAWFNLGYVRLRSGMVRTALEATEKALELRPGYPEAIGNRACCLFCLLPAGPALEAVEAAVQQRPDDAALKVLAVLALLRNGKLEAARVHLDEIAARGVDVMGFIRQLAEIMRAVGNAAAAGEIASAISLVVGWLGSVSAR